MKIYAIVSGDGYQIKTVEETEKAYKITWDFETGIMTVADEESAITIPDERYNYEEMYKKLNVAYYIDYYEGTQLETGVTATPKKTAQTIKPSKGYDGLKQVAIEATPLEEKNATPSTSSQEIVATTDGKIGLSKVIIEATPLETASVTPTTSPQTIEPTGTGMIGLSSVSVSAVTSAIDANIVAENIKNGVTILGVEGTYTGEQI